MQEYSTREKFLEKGKEEFLEKGFKDTSLRQLCKSLNMTLGAFYGYFSGKEALFDAIVSHPAQELLEYYEKSHADYMKMDARTQFDQVGEVSIGCWEYMLQYMYQYYDEFKLLFCCASGTKYEKYMEEFIKIEVKDTRQFLNLMESNQIMKVDIDDQLSHILATMLFKGIIEIFEHDMKYEYAKNYVNKLRIFYTAGWMEFFKK